MCRCANGIDRLYEEKTANSVENTINLFTLMLEFVMIYSFMNKEKIDQNPVLKLSFEFTLQIIEFCEMPESEKKFVIVRQLLKSGTSVGANATEAQNSESKADFIHELK